VPEDIVANRCLRALAVIALALAVAACASTTIRAAWYDSSYAGGPFRKIVVVGSHANIAVRRSFEDIFVDRLRAAGVDAKAGYLVLPPNAAPGDTVWNAAVEASGADGLLAVRLLGVDTKTEVYTTMTPGPMMWGYGGFWGPGMVAVPQVVQYDVATVETTLWQVRTKSVVWSASTDTFNPASVQQEAPGFANLIIGQLAARGLIATTK
jgi:hypothetical protein